MRKRGGVLEGLQSSESLDRPPTAPPRAPVPGGSVREAAQGGPLPASRRLQHTEVPPPLPPRLAHQKVPIWGLARLNPTEMETSDPVIGRRPLRPDHRRDGWAA